MNRFQAAALVSMLLVALMWQTAWSQPANRPYRLESVDLKQRVIWGAELKLPDGTGLAFGGQDQDADDGRPHTRILSKGQWTAIHEQLRQRNLNQPLHDVVWTIRNDVKRLQAQFRAIHFKGMDGEKDQESALLLHPTRTGLSDKLNMVSTQLEIVGRNNSYFNLQRQRAAALFKDAGTLIFGSDDHNMVARIQALHRAQIQLEIAATMLDAEPPARAMNCGKPQRKDDNSPESQAIVFDKKTGLYLIFGGDHLDYLTNDTWVFDPKGPKWELRHPKFAPPPRANHRLVANGDGTVTLTGGYTYSSNTDYVGGQYIDLNDGTWTYDITRNEWTGGKLVSPDSRTYRDGPFHPDYYLHGDKPDAAKFQTWLKDIPDNKWVATNPPYRPRLNRDWGTARLDPSRDIILRWSGGHSAHGGTDVPHYHFATNRWELAFPVEFPLGQLYSNTSYPNGYNFNLRPWMTGHTYQNYAYDPPSRMMIKAGRPRHFYVYDPDLGDWIGRGEKPRAMQYNSCFYTLTLTATPGGIVCWDKDGRVHQYNHKAGDKAGAWNERKLTGDKLPGAYVDNSTIVYDSRRDRVLMFNTPGYGKTYTGEVYALDLKTNNVTTIAPANRDIGKRFATIDKSCYDATNDLVLIGTYLKDEGGAATGHTPTPAFDCKTDRWITLDIAYDVGKRGSNIVRHFPHVRSDGLMYDEKRKLIWGTDTNSQVYVLRLVRP